MADQSTPSAARGDEAELFRTHNEQLMHEIARSLVTPAPTVVEDACSFAWSQFMYHQPDRDRNWQGWLFRTAQREAWKLEREARETLPLRSSEGDRLGPYVEVPDRRDVHAIHMKAD